ncbi:MAG: inorganic diphosphatase [Alphaproteobacteria bacterium]|nr:inorganic diphosphatase [Alphaproteobacteria bacterium]OJV13740.1 MAG: inorganic pyrophosphatase [Alphaproteobacteria bacterium 33-17]
MDIAKVGHGDKAPEEVHVIIEVPKNSDPVKYEFDKESGAIFVDRFVHTCMYYPCNYGFIPNTLSGDGDPVDVLVVSNFPVIPGAVLKSRPVGVLMMEDESGVDEKILAVPVSKLEKHYDNIKSYKDLPQILLDQISHFFEHYKDLEKGKWVKVKEWQDADSAKKIILEGIKNCK